MRRSRLGITMIELLVALAIFATVFALSSKGIVTGLQGQKLLDDVASSQSRVRRVSEVMTQQLRGTVFGSISSLPYRPDASQVSFAVLDGSGGFQVLPDPLSPGTVHMSNIQILAANIDDVNSLALSDKQAMVINDDGALVAFKVNSVQNSGSQYQLSVSNATCNQSLIHSNNTLLFKGNLVGYRHDADENILYRRLGNAEEVPLAYNISDMEISYLYKDNGDSSVTARKQPLFNGSQAVNQGSVGGSTVTLVALEIKLTTEDQTRQGTIKKSYSSQIDLVDSSRSDRIRRITGVSICN